MASTTTTRSPFLDVLPPELRLHIYSHLLVASSPLKGPVARQDTSYDLHTAILRTNKQIYHEARSIFFGRNTFYITSIPPSRPSTGSDEDAEDHDEEEGSGAFEPPLQLRDLPLVRHLQVDLLYYPKSMHTIRDRRSGIWIPVCVGAQRYSTSLSFLLSAVETRLLSLKLCADTRRYIDESRVCGSSSSSSSNSGGGGGSGGGASSTSSSNVNNNSTTSSSHNMASTSTSTSSNPSPSMHHHDHASSSWSKDHTARLEAQQMLTGFYMADANPLFRKALARLHIADIALHFDFPESYFDFLILRSVLCQQNLVELAGQVLALRSHIRRKAARQHNNNNNNHHDHDHDHADAEADGDYDDGDGDGDDDDDDDGPALASQGSLSSRRVIPPHA
ncbi:hypothetical protein ACJBU6_08441 [Exserohilum turcicum]